MDDNNKIRIIRDTVDGSHEEELNLEDLSLEQLRELISAGWTDLYGYYEERTRMAEAGIDRYWPDGQPVYKIKDEMVSLFCVLDQRINAVVGILNFSGGFGFAVRTERTWKTLSKESQAFEEYFFNPNLRVFQIDWQIEPIIDADPADEGAWEHQLVQAWDQSGSISIEEMAKYSFEVDPEQVSSL